MDSTVITGISEPITQACMDTFRNATKGMDITKCPPTLFTRYREPEYEWLEKLKVDLKYLLHGEQEYEFFKPLKPGSVLKIETSVLDQKERSGRTGRMRIIKLFSKFFDEKEPQLIATSITTFVVREPAVEGA